MIYKKIDTVGKLNEFINSSKNEPEFFNIDKEKLISLREYLEGLKKLYSLYSFKIRSPFMSIAKKNNWIMDIQPNFNHFTSSVLDIIDYNGNITTISKRDGKYVVCLDPTLREEKLCRDYDTELKEIEKVAEEYVVDGEIVTASDNFSLRIQNFDKIDLRMNLQNFIDNDLSYKSAEEAALQYYSTFLLQNQILEKKKDMVFKKIYLKK